MTGETYYLLDTDSQEYTEHDTIEQVRARLAEEMEEYSLTNEETESAYEVVKGVPIPIIVSTSTDVDILEPPTAQPGEWLT